MGDQPVASAQPPPEAAPAPKPEPPTPSTEFGGEVQIGGRPGPRWLRLWYYVVYLWAIGYLVGAFIIDRVRQGAGAYYGIVIGFAVVLTGWLVYIVWKKQPPEP